MAILSKRGQSAQSFRMDGKAIFMIFLGAIITATLITSIADQVFTETNTISVNNLTVTLSGSANGTTDIQGRELNLQREIYNATGTNDSFAGIPEGVSMRTATGSNGLLSVQLLINDTGIDAGHASTTINVSYDANPDGYVGNTTGGVSITNLIVLFSALAILVFVVVVIFKVGSFSFMRFK